MKRTLLLIYLTAMAVAVSAQTPSAFGRMVALSWAGSTVERLYDDVRHIKVSAEGLTVCTHDGTPLASAPLVAGLKISSYYKDEHTGVEGIGIIPGIGLRVAGRTAYLTGIPAEGTHCAVYSTQGLRLIHAVIDAAPGERTLDLSGLLPGLYILTADSATLKFRLD